MYDKIRDYLVDYCCVFFRGKGFVNKIILWAQSIYTKEMFGIKSMFSHIGIIIHGYFYESTVIVTKEKGKKFLFFRLPKVKKKAYGWVRTSLEEKFNGVSEKNCELLGFQSNFNFTDIERDEIKEKVEDMIGEEINYGSKELIGTLIRIFRWRIANEKKRKELLQQANRFDTSNVYCIAGVADGIEASKREYISVHHSISTVDEGWFNCKIPCMNRIIKMKNII